MEMKIVGLDMASAVDFRTFIVFFFMLCVVSALFSCVISYTARKSGLKEYMIKPSRQIHFAPSTKSSFYNSNNNNTKKQQIIDVKEWISLVLNPEKPFDKEMIVKDLTDVLEAPYMYRKAPSRYSQTLHYDEMLY